MGETAREGTIPATNAVETQGKGSVLVAKAVETQGKGSVLTAKAVETQGKGNVLAANAVEIQGKGSTNAVETQGNGSCLTESSWVQLSLESSSASGSAADTALSTRCSFSSHCGLVRRRRCTRCQPPDTRVGAHVVG